MSIFVDILRRHSSRHELNRLNIRAGETITKMDRFLPFPMQHLLTTPLVDTGGRMLTKKNAET